MASTNKKIQDQLDLASNERKEIIKLIKSLNMDVNILKENSFRSDAKLSDLSSKVDLDLCTINITSVNAGKNKASASTDIDKKPKLNIMSYFKQQYKLDPALIYSIVSEDDMNKLFGDNMVEIKKREKKKEPISTYKASLIYGSLIKGNKDRTAKLRTMKEQDESRNTVVDPEITEHNIDDDDDNDISNKMENLDVSDAESSDNESE